MRLLLFFICMLFSGIFYVANHINSWKKLFWYTFDRIRLESFTWNLMIESFIFLALGIFFVFYFTPNLKVDFIFEKVEKYFKYYYFWYFILFWILLFSWKIFYDMFVLFWIIFFIFSNISFYLVSNLEYFREQKENLRYFWLFLNFASSFISIYYIFNFEFSLLLILVLIFNLFFYYSIFKKYWNIACLWAYYVIIIFCLLFLILKIYYLLELNLIF